MENTAFLVIKSIKEQCVFYWRFHRWKRHRRLPCTFFMMLAKIPDLILHAFLTDHWLIHLLLWAFFFFPFPASASPGATLSISGLFLGLPTCPFSLKHCCLRLPQLLFPFLYHLNVLFKDVKVYSAFIVELYSFYLKEKKKRLFSFAHGWKVLKLSRPILLTG